MLNTMRMVMIGILVALASGCWLRGVRDSDLQSWSGVHVDKLRVHPLFSTMPKREEPLSDGRQVWIYSNCASGPVRCHTNEFGGTVCNGGGEVCCSNQFTVRGDRVESYQAAGQCYTDCSVRPGGTCG